MLLCMQGAQSDELLPGTYLARRPAMPPQVLQQRKLLFRSFSSSHIAPFWAPRSE